MAARHPGGQLSRGVATPLLKHGQRNHASAWCRQSGSLPNQTLCLARKWLQGIKSLLGGHGAIPIPDDQVPVQVDPSTKKGQIVCAESAASYDMHIGRMATDI